MVEWSKVPGSLVVHNNRQLIEQTCLIEEAGEVSHESLIR